MTTEPIEAKKIVLIVDDKALNRRVISSVLRREDYELLYAENGVQCLEIARERKPHLILLDVMMPEMDGYETCEKLKEHVSTSIIPIIFVTAKNSNKDMEKAFELGAADYLQKPINTSELKARVAAQLRLHDFESVLAHSEQLEYLSRNISKYISPKLLEYIVGGSIDTSAPPLRKQLSIFFSDIIGFTEITDSSEPELITTILNTYFNDMAAIVTKHGGTIDKFMGDAILAFFGDPESKGAREDAHACIEMALEMRTYINQFDKRMEEMGISTTFRIRMGINTGYCTVGNFGSDNHLDYTIVGSPVNATERLQSLANPNQILISDQTWQLIKDSYLCRKAELITMKGFTHPVQTYEVVDLRSRIGSAEALMHSREVDGFSLSYDMRQLPKNELLKILREEMSKVEAIEEDSASQAGVESLQG